MIEYAPLLAEFGQVESLNAYGKGPNPNLNKICTKLNM